MRDFELFHVIPAQWTTFCSLRVVNSHLRESVFDNFSEFLRQNWSLTTPHLNLSHHPSLFDFVENPSEWSGSILVQFFVVEMLMLWNLIITFILAIMIWRHPVLLFLNCVSVAEASIFTDNMAVDTFFVILGLIFALFVGCSMWQQGKRLCTLNRRNSEDRRGGTLVIDNVAYKVSLDKYNELTSVNMAVPAPP